MKLCKDDLNTIINQVSRQVALSTNDAMIVNIDGFSQALLFESKSGKRLAPRWVDIKNVNLGFRE